MKEMKEKCILLENIIIKDNTAESVKTCGNFQSQSTTYNTFLELGMIDETKYIW